MAGVGISIGAETSVASPNIQSILTLRNHVNCHGLTEALKHMERMQDTGEDCSGEAGEGDHGAKADKNPHSTTLREIARTSKLTQEGYSGGCTVESWLSKVERLVPTKLIAWICCRCEADIRMESLQGFRRRLRTTVAATIIDD